MNPSKHKRLIIKAVTSAKQAYVAKTASTSYRIAVTAAPAKGQANAAIIQALAKYLRVAPSRLSIKRGHTSRTKIIELAN